MNVDRNEQGFVGTLRWGVKEWSALVTLGVLILGFLVRQEARMTAVETHIEYSRANYHRLTELLEDVKQVKHSVRNGRE